VERAVRQVHLAGSVAASTKPEMLASSFVEVGVGVQQTGLGAQLGLDEPAYPVDAEQLGQVGRVDRCPGSARDPAADRVQPR